MIYHTIKISSPLVFVEAQTTLVVKQETELADLVAELSNALFWN